MSHVRLLRVLLRALLAIAQDVHAHRRRGALQKLADAAALIGTMLGEHTDEANGCRLLANRVGMHRLPSDVVIGCRLRSWERKTKSGGG